MQTKQILNNVFDRLKSGTVQAMGRVSKPHGSNEIQKKKKTEISLHTHPTMVVGDPAMGAHEMTTSPFARQGLNRVFPFIFVQIHSRV